MNTEKQTYPKETLKALKESCQHWYDNMNHAIKGDVCKIDISQRGCALCMLYYYIGCAGCPVFMRKEKRRCIDTPYYTVDVYMTEYFAQDYADAASQDLIASACTNEFKFLLSLLPDNELFVSDDGKKWSNTDQEV